jgi:prepilin signal peptidase PulO-like enzyme (type II secretory pathway)
MIVLFLTGIFLIFCSYTDIRYKKISIFPPAIYAAFGTAISVCIISGLDIYSFHLSNFYLFSKELLQVSSNSILHTSPASIFLSLGSCAIMFIFSIISSGGIAIGDCIVMSALACCMSPYYLISIIFFGFIFSGLTSLFLITVKKRSKKDTMPFAPFLLAGYLCCLTVIYL